MSDAHAAEYLAAAAALHDQTPLPEPRRQEPAVGDFVSGCTCGRRWSGHVMTAEPGRLAVECSGAWIVVDPQDITH